MSVSILEEVTTEPSLAQLALSNPEDNSSHSSLQLEHNPPPATMPDGYEVGMRLYFTGGSFKMSSNNWLVQGAQGEVMGPAASAAFTGVGVAVRFPNNATNVDCFVEELSREPPTSLPAPVAAPSA